MTWHQGTWKRRLCASFGLTILLSGGLVESAGAQQPSGISTTGVSNGYPLPRGKQGVYDLEPYNPNDPASIRRFQAFDVMGIGLSRHDYSWANLEQQYSHLPGQVISSYATLPGGPGPHCASGYTLFPTDNAHKAALQFNRFHCYNAATIAAMDTRMAKEYASGIQSAATLFHQPAMHNNPSCTVGACVPYTEIGLQDWQDYIAFMASRYGGQTSLGKLYHYIIWNEVDEAIYFNMDGMINPATSAPINQNAPGPISTADKEFWARHVAEMIKRAHVAINRHTSGVMLYVCLTGLWQQQYRWGGKIHIAGNYIVERMWYELGLNYDWSIALHPYQDADNDNHPQNVNFSEIRAERHPVPAQRTHQSGHPRRQSPELSPEPRPGKRAGMAKDGRA